MLLGFPLNTAALACRLGRVGHVLPCLLDRGVRQEGHIAHRHDLASKPGLPAQVRLSPLLGVGATDSPRSASTSATPTPAFSTRADCWYSRSRATASAR